MAVYTQSEYAKRKGVSQPYINRLIKEDKLVTIYEHGKKVVVDCPQNDALFKKPNVNRGGNKNERERRI